MINTNIQINTIYASIYTYIFLTCSTSLIKGVYNHNDTYIYIIYNNIINLIPHFYNFIVFTDNNIDDYVDNNIDDYVWLWWGGGYEDDYGKGGLGSYDEVGDEYDGG